MKIPDYLLHKPIVKAESYEAIDGRYKNESDARGLSLGISQWNEDTLSAKVWRKSNKRWSRQSEELPLHRVLDLALLILKTKLLLKENINEELVLSQGDEKIKIEVVKDMEINKLREIFETTDSDFLDERIKEILRTCSLLLNGEKK